MVLEALLTPQTAERHPFESLVLGFVYGTFGLFLALWIFEQYASLVMIFLTTIAALPLFYHTVISEEEKDLVPQSEYSLLRGHSHALTFLLFLFIGASLAYSFWYIVLPTPIGNQVFSAQTETIVTLNQKVTGSVTQFNIFGRVFLNNVKVMIFCIIFSFLYGAGSLFILMWNASVIGAAVGNFIRVKLAVLAATIGLNTLAAYLYAISLSILRYALHGIPEILAYVVAGLAGGILSTAIIRKDYTTRNFERIVLDTSDLILIALALLAVAAGVEVYVTPMFF